MTRELNKLEFKRFTVKYLAVTSILVGLYLMYGFFLVGWRLDHFNILILCLGCFYAHPVSRRVLAGFSIFLLYALIYDSMKAYPNYWFADVHVEDLYQVEKYLFGISTTMGIITPNEYFNANHTTFMDILSGIFYINWMPVPILFGLYLFVKDKLMLMRYSAAFLTVNLLGFIVYYTYPAAPPWYYEMYGNVENFSIPGNVAGLIRFDDFFGITTFQNIYSKGSNVFAAMPSLHSAYPLVVLFYGIKRKIRWMTIVFTIFTLGTWFAAVYTSHHYIIDVLVGVICAVIGLYLFEKILMKTTVGNVLTKFAEKYV